MTQETLKLALAALENGDVPTPENVGKNLDAITAIKEALAQEQEPVAWMHVQGNYKEPSFRELADDEVERGWEQYPLYNTPPQRTWVGLTDEEKSKLWEVSRAALPRYATYAILIEDKLKQKNGYAEEKNT
jgi:hypothetical protein